MGSNTPGAASSAADLEAQETPTSRPKPEKIDVKEQHVSGIDFYWVQAPFSEDFLMVIRRKCGTDFELRVEAANPENSDFLYGKCIFLRKPRQKIY